jgi:hypothetical protein
LPEERNSLAISQEHLRLRLSGACPRREHLSGDSLVLAQVLIEINANILAYNQEHLRKRQLTGVYLIVEHLSGASLI